MKTIRPIALAVLAVCSAAAQAQSASNVTLFGVADASIRSVRADGAGSATQVGADGNTSSRLGFRGTEDLGGGLQANFWLEAAVSVDTGAGGTTNVSNVGANTATGAFTFGRRATVGMSGSWGEFRLGRDYVPTFNNLTVAMHPFGTNGLGNAGALFYPVAAGGTTPRTNVRASNSIGYVLPSNLGGLNGHLMYALGEQTPGTATADDGKYMGARIGYGSGPLNLALATGKTSYSTGDYTQSNFAINYQWGPAKLMYLWGQNKVGVTKTTANMIGTQWKLGPGELRFAYTTLKADGVANDANHIALGYVYDLSKRTALYANIAQVNNKGTGKTFAAGDGIAPTTAGGNSSGVEFGIRHSF